ncbi:DUF1254 domain-containing protein [Pseudomonas sp. 5P_3.1_Bac2]|uniref:DUF1254 domain-containing protein n=1 Tax=Pseudomonas sp. 5P_3.1_Bac2 TaxID=2971617 RepID=UPI0021C849F2|nr:DUF1254 domain-containing protein [Pseudomonas sp. 5P_3.1_Bac2]MCU1717064.1 DUF1254 domain-containing protein [Pseudomonas sp. 5P_3.1_Bac2]
MPLRKLSLPLSLAISLAAGSALPLAAYAANSVAPTAQAAAYDQEQFKTLARDVYMYAYPLVVMDLTMRQSTNVPDANTTARRAPINQFAHYREYPSAEAKEVVRFNFDTLYSLAWLDVSKEPMILSLPDSQGRYYLAPLLDMWTDVYAVPGTRTTGNKAGNYAITAPGWKGELPAGVEEIKSPTSLTWLITRILTNGPADYANVHQFQDHLKITPLSLWGTDYTPPVKQPVDATIDNKTPPQHQINAMDGVQVLTRFAQLLKTHQPHANDYPILHRMRALGLEPGKDFDTSRFSPEQLQVLRDAAKASQQEIFDAISSASMGKYKNGWNWADNLGTYGTNYRLRALVALAGLGANPPEDAIYPNNFRDANGKPYSGKNDYVLRFEPGQLPPAGAFWSLTLYDHEGFQVSNPINRFALGSYDKFKYGEDGSLELYLQNKAPAKDKENNWLPTPEGNFQLTLRLYLPKPEVLDGSWSAPAVKQTR